MRDDKNERKQSKTFDKNQRESQRGRCSGGRVKHAELCLVEEMILLQGKLKIGPEPTKVYVLNKCYNWKEVG